MSSNKRIKKHTAEYKTSFIQVDQKLVIPIIPMSRHRDKKKQYTGKVLTNSDIVSTKNQTMAKGAKV